MKRRTIAIDIDDVLSPFHDLIIAHHNEKYGTDFPVEGEPGKYHIDQYTGDSREMTREKLRGLLDSAAFQNALPLQGAIEVIGRLKRDYNLEIVTGRQDFFESFTQQWLQKHFPKTFAGIHIDQYVPGNGLKIPKLELCRKVGADYLIDDNLETAIECAAAGIQVVLFGDYPWNQALELVPEIVRCKDWREVESYFNGRS